MTLHKYIFRELLRVFLFAAVGLTLILSLGSILQPVQEYGVGPKQVLHLMVCFLPITLTFVLPMAALFAGALIYGRFASDNELDACRASGISLITLTFPGLVLAILVALANLFLSFHVMPIFVLRAEKSLKADAKQIVFRKIQRSRYYEVPPNGETLIYADHADIQDGKLWGAVVAEMENSRMVNMTTSEMAEVRFKTHDTYNEVQITAYKSSQMGPQGWGYVGTLPVTQEFGSLLGDEIRFKKLGEMRSISADMMRFYPIEKLARQMYTQLILEILARDIQTWIRETRDRAIEGQKSTYELLGTPNSVKITVDQCKVRRQEIELSGDIEMTEYDTADMRPLRTLTCTTATLHLEGEIPTPTVTLDIHSPQSQGFSGGTEEWKLRHVIADLKLPMAVLTINDEYKTPSGSLKVKKLASALSELPELEPSKYLRKYVGQLDRQIKGTVVEIKSEIHSRLVFGLGCIPMILIGIGLGVLKKGGHLLSAFGASCVPAAILIVCILSGKQIIENLDAQQTVSGVALMWGGLGFLFFLAFVTYSWLLKH
ncbi:MAG: LptF/LptG family permease [Sedimentisphaerales bacterium]|nr:LptF/LptG family permease [Sedimentisphaerales bacterium]